ncbi:hypothetical protein EU538_09575 [Candidatus Thorarchaeota archaeon]|nr:MAG: hypothetical protein EU538_09575 [Candidatus Thorarchaeota archaeon]
MNEDGSKIGRRLKRTGDLLVGGAQEQVSSYKTRFEALEGSYDAFLSQLLHSYTDSKLDTSFVDEFFGKRKISFAGVDGTVCKNAVFDLLIFFAGAYANRGELTVHDSGEFDIAYEEKFIDSGLGISSVLPVYINEVPYIDQTVLIRDEEGAVDEMISQTDSWIIDNSAFADYMMGLSEFYLALKLVTEPNDVDVLLMDRVLSSELSSFYAETSDFRVNLDKECGLIGYKLEGERFSKTDWIYARRLFGNKDLQIPPARGEYLLPRIVVELRDQYPTGLERDEIADRLGLTSDHQLDRLDKELQAGMKGKGEAKAVIRRKGKHFTVVPSMHDLLPRLEKLVFDVCERIFSEDPDVTFRDRFKIDSRWLTTNDLAFLSLVSLNLVTMKCWKKRKLLIGVAKDTSARDLKRQLLPVLNYTGHFEGGFQESGADVPDTDRMILQWVSLKERDRLDVPWATVEYDTAFKTIVPHLEGRKGLVSGARRNQISLNKMFLKAYFQLSEAKTDPKLRSNVLLYDRLAYPGFDDREECSATLKHDYGGHPDDPELVDAIFYHEANNPIQRFILQVFRRMTSPSIPELFGHLRPLYVADKVAKFYFNQFNSMVASTGSWLVNRPELREFIFYLSTFRERRSDVEQTRRHT